MPKPKDPEGAISLEAEVAGVTEIKDSKKLERLQSSF